MAYDLKLAQRIAAELGDLPAVEKHLFGGTCFLLNGNMAVGVIADGLIVRVPPAEHADLLKRANVRPFDFSGRPMKGWLVVDAPGTKTKKQLGAWVRIGVDFALSLPPKK